LIDIFHSADNNEYFTIVSLDFLQNDSSTFSVGFLTLLWIWTSRTRVYVFAFIDALSSCHYNSSVF